MLLFLPALLLASCDRAPKTPAGAVEACLEKLSAGDVEGAAEMFARGDRQLKWFETYYRDQPIAELFDGPIGNVYANGDEVVVTYRPKKTLFNAFGKDDLVLVVQEEGEWKVDFEKASQLKNAINGGGVKTNLSILGDCITEATEKLGRVPSSIQETIDNLDGEGAKSSFRSYSRMFNYHPEGEEIDGVEGVIFYSKKPYRHGMNLGATNGKLFLSGDGEVIIETRISLL